MNLPATDDGASESVSTGGVENAPRRKQPCPVFVISLPGSDARRAGMAAQLQALGLAFEIVDGVRGSALTDAEKAATVGPEAEMRRHIGRAMTPGEIGCALSHQKVYELILARGYERAFILEDDAQLLPGFADALAGAVAVDLDILLFGYPKLSDDDVRMAWLYDPVLTLGHAGAGHIYGIRPRQSHLGMVGYLVSRQACARLRRNFPVVTVADDHHFFAKDLRIWHLRPFAVMEDTMHVSTIRGDFRRNRAGLSLRQRLSRSLRGILRHVQVQWLRMRGGRQAGVP